MASIGSLSFFIETAMESSVLHCGNLHRPRFLILGSRGRTTLDLRSNVTMGLSVNCENMIDECNRRRPWRSKSMRAMRINAKKSEDRDKSEDPLEATIEKSKKVLAMQKQLLDQLAERRKLVTSLKNSLMESEEEAVSYRETDNSVSNLDHASDGAGETYASSTADSAPDSISGNFGDSDKEPEQRPLEIFSSHEDSSVIDKTDSDAVQLDGLPYFLSKTSEPHGLEDNEEKKSTEFFLEDVTIEANRAPEEENTKPPPLAGANVMNIILVAAECAPWSKTGGLGDVAGALPKALARRGHRVMVVAPRYGNYTELHDTGVRKRYNVTGQDVEVTYHQTYIDGVDFVFIDNHMFHHIEHNIYGGQRVEILRRMVLFCKAAVEVPWHVPCGGVCYGDGNLVFIANDWHTALLPVYLKAYYRDNGLMNYTRSVLVIHNIAHQGRGPLDDFSYMDLPGHYIDLFKLYDPLGGEHCNIFAAGLKAADRIVTVSHGYSWELKTLEGGWGLHGIINDNHWKLSGIVNGIDTKEWSPQVDVHLKSDGYTNYSLETLHTGKPKCKKALQKELAFPFVRCPLIGSLGD
ncbi:hypothetical protein AQUCO_00200621v1 [Aquilegia coerulea]|uniref:starch synthase n=1 Tax=Aquilegia coerulea TaxID=218851 RepID=A0A2G5F490_AQUCA|nr:hypothetical protein AQUCO_00200621v1 [Aquilegia coerulea]